MTKDLALPTLIALCSIALKRPVQSSLVVLGDISISGTLMKVRSEEHTSELQIILQALFRYVLIVEQRRF